MFGAHRWSAVGLAVAGVAIFVVVPAGPVAAATCTQGQWRGADIVQGGPGSYDGVNAQMNVPPLSALGNYSKYPPGGDVYVNSPAGDMVQFGWSVHNGATVLWWKEALPGKSETGPTPTATISSGFHNFRVLWLPAYSGSTPIANQYAFYVDGSLFQETVNKHPYNEPTAGVTGEQDNTCGVMLNDTERSPNPPYGTLWYHTEPSGWVFWNSDDRFTQNPANSSEYHSSPVLVQSGYSSTGTDVAAGGPS
jgi:hypothetical protein